MLFKNKLTLIYLGFKKKQLLGEEKTEHIVGKVILG